METRDSMVNGTTHIILFDLTHFGSFAHYIEKLFKHGKVDECGSHSFKCNTQASRSYFYKCSYQFPHKTREGSRMGPCDCRNSNKSLLITHFE